MIRIRSYTQLEGEGLKVAEGDCPNHLLESASIKEPLISSSLTEKPKIGIKEIYEYDISTTIGGDYRIASKLL